MKVLQLGKFYPIKGGVEKVMYDLTDGLAHKDVRCDMLCANINTSVRQRQIINISRNANVISVPAIVKKYATMLSPSMVFELKSICNDYDIIHIHHPDPMAALALRLSGYKGKVVLHWHSDILKQAYVLKLYKYLQNWLIKRSDVIVGTTPVYVANSPYLRKVQDKCTFLPIGVEPVDGNGASSGKIRSLHEGKRIIFSLGRLVHYKGFKYLVEAARYLPDDCVVLIGGSGELKDELEKQIASSHLQGKVRLLGRISDEELPDYYMSCDLFCLSSIQKTEAFAIVQIEAMSCGKPVVATNIKDSGVSWVNAHGESGLNVEPENAKALAGAIIKILDDRELYDRLSKKARERYNQLFRKDIMIDKCLAIYNGIFKE